MKGQSFEESVNLIFRTDAELMEESERLARQLMEEEEAQLVERMQQEQMRIISQMRETQREQSRQDGNGDLALALQIAVR